MERDLVTHLQSPPDNPLFTYAVYFQSAALLLNLYTVLAKEIDL